VYNDDAREGEVDVNNRLKSMEMVDYLEKLLKGG
jgi:hypothetical protein